MKLALITSSRADYGLLKPLIRRLNSDSFFDLRIIATGTHLSSEFGNTYKEIEEDGFHIHKKIRILQKKDNELSVTKVCSSVFLEFGKLYHTLKPDALLVLGDRYEIFCAVNTALFFKIPIIHYSGGEKTEGAYDDALRHCITKMSHLHFTSCEEYKNRVIQLGEQPKSVFNVGSLGIDNIKNMKLLSKQDFEKSIHVKLSELFFLVSFHPETLSNVPVKNQFKEVLSALAEFKAATIVFTKSNADSNGRVINSMIDDFVKKNENAISFESLGLLRYLSAIKYCNVVIGNSSSGITEVPFFNKPTVNIGNRQKGRLMSKSVFNCVNNKKDILDAIEFALKYNLTKPNGLVKPIFGDGNTSRKMVSIIKKYNFKNSVSKVFYDL